MRGYEVLPEGLESCSSIFAGAFLFLSRTKGSTAVQSEAYEEGSWRSIRFQNTTNGLQHQAADLSFKRYSHLRLSKGEKRLGLGSKTPARGPAPK